MIPDDILTEPETIIVDACRNAFRNRSHMIRHGGSDYVDDQHGSGTSLYGAPAGRDYAETHFAKIVTMLRKKAEERAYDATLYLPKMGNDAGEGFAAVMREKLPHFGFTRSGTSATFTWQELVLR